MDNAQRVIVINRECAWFGLIFIAGRVVDKEHMTALNGAGTEFIFRKNELRFCGCGPRGDDAIIKQVRG